ncbi:hypothetical protein UFOVP9_44 [uncultured Caudovirales phage]|jgi:hypothetical protein|uniref:Uncharacterized protein n=1 Tax=uncultured Caudovirales phage TaxID=2100421 RepID=A0A6J5KIA1_9CAUD|nr:hypothetical protein UFOVP9_44 [uncultured Caudovirales phage]
MKMLLLLVFTPLMASYNTDFDRQTITEIEREREVTKYILTERLHVIDRQLDYLRARLKVTGCPETMMEEAEKVQGDKKALVILLNRMKK